MKPILLLCFLCLASFQNKGKEVIVWEPGKMLAWTDFKGKPDSGSSAVAITSSGIGFKLITKKDNTGSKYTVEVYAYFSTKDSWYKRRYVNENVLMHEQLHFDITALYGQKLIARIDAFEFKDDVKNSVEKLYNEVVAEMDSVQKLYDKQTEASINEAAQVFWQSKIRKELNWYLIHNNKK